jgi:hypothetical protein
MLCFFDRSCPLSPALFCFCVTGSLADIPMAATKQDSLILCQSQEKNISNKIFGGHALSSRD